MLRAAHQRSTSTRVKERRGAWLGEENEEDYDTKGRSQLV